MVVGSRLEARAREREARLEMEAEVRRAEAEEGEKDGEDDDERRRRRRFEEAWRRLCCCSLLRRWPGGRGPGSGIQFGIGPQEAHVWTLKREIEENVFFHVLFFKFTAGRRERANFVVVVLKKTVTSSLTKSQHSLKIFLSSSSP